MTLKASQLKVFVVIMLLIMAVVSINVPRVFAQAAPTTSPPFSQDDINSIIGQTPFFDPNALTTPACSTSTSSAPAAPVAPGTGAPNGAAFPSLDPAAMAAAINTYIKQYNAKSELNGLGTTVVADGQHSNVSPFLIVALAQAESSLASPTDYNVEHGNNSFGRKATPSQPNFPGAGVNAGTLWYKWSSVEASVDYTAPENQGAVGGGDIASYIRDQYGKQLDVDNIAAMISTYWNPGSDEGTIVQNLVNKLVSLTTGQPATTTPTTTTPTTTTTCPTTSVSGTSTAGCSGDASILCEAEKYNGIYYSWGAGHGYVAFRKACPETAIAGAVTASTAANPGPCATDCSGLVSVAVDAVFNQNYNWTVLDNKMVGPGSQNWQSIPLSQAQAGDIVTRHTGGNQPDDHVEIVVSVSGNTVNTFGSHETGVRTGPAALPSSYWDAAWQWNPGGS